MRSIGLESKCRQSTDDRIGMKHFASFEDFSARSSFFHEIDGILGKLVGLVGIFFEDGGGEEFASLDIFHEHRLKLIYFI